MEKDKVWSMVSELVWYKSSEFLPRAERGSDGTYSTSVTVLVYNPEYLPWSGGKSVFHGWYNYQTGVWAYFPEGSSASKTVPLPKFVYWAYLDVSKLEPIERDYPPVDTQE